MAEGPYLMGIDFGTGGVRVGIVDPAGAPEIISTAEFSTHHPQPGRAEQDPDEWWAALVVAVRRALADGGVGAEAIAGISVDATSSTVLMMDDDDRHLGPAILWMDVRASDQAERIGRTGHPALKYTGHGTVSAEWGLPKALWLKENEPKTWARARHLVDCVDWVTHRLTGEWTASVNVASAKYFHDRDEGGFPDDLFATVGIEDLLEKYPGTVLDIGDVVGGLRRDVAEELGLRPGTPVAQGAIDAYAGALGLGVVDPGQLALITGSSHVMIGQAASPVHGEGIWGSYTDAMIRGQYTVEAGQASTGSVVAWFKKHLAGNEIVQAQERGVDPYVLLNEKAGEVAIGSDGLIVVDYFQGNRSPHTDPLARGMIWGLSLSHGSGHLFRALLEGICYGTEDILATMRGHGFEPSSIMVSGGPTASELWMQMHADVSNVPISFTTVAEGPVLGSAMLAAVGAGVHPDIHTAAEHMVHVTRTLEPDQARHEDYRFYLERYLETYPSMREAMHKTVRHVAARG
jgi:FGGY-family pentulose kinase